MKPFRLIFLLSASVALLACGCSVDGLETVDRGPVEVAFSTGGSCTVDAVDLTDGIGASTKTTIGEDGLSLLWETTDKVWLWARPSAVNGDEFVLKQQPFGLYGTALAKTYFSTTLASPMEDGSYDYFCCSPEPMTSDTDITNALFVIPFTQDGKGEGIMISEPMSAGPLKPLSEYVESEAVSMKMAQQAHLLQLYVKDPYGVLGDEKVQKILLTFPAEVVGRVSANLVDPTDGLSLVGGSKSLTLEPENEIAPSTGEGREYTYATILPQQWQLADAIGVKIYTETKLAEGKDVALLGRNMEAGHATPICLTADYVKTYCKFTFTLTSNPTGEDLTSITLTAPSGCKWGDKGTNVYVYSPGGTIPVGTSFVIEYENERNFRALDSQNISLSFESEHVITSGSLTIPSLSGKYNAQLSMDVPWLLYEDFSSVPSFSSDDEYNWSKAGSYSPHTFLNGWSAARAGASAGKCIRIACRRETTADYDARADSAPLSCTFKKATNINVAFSFGSNNKYGGLAIITDGNVGQTCYLGYIATYSNYKSGDGDGTFEDGNSFYTKEYNGSWDNTPNDTDYTIHNILPGTSPVRITWRTEVEHQEGTTNTTAWLYIDNVKVTIAN